MNPLPRPTLSLPARPRLLLAPMEGLLDATLRDALTLEGPACGLDRCVSEFIRVTDTLLPPRALRRVVPELDTGSRTPGGVPVRPQLLGSDPACLADNAARLVELGAEGVDLNFGCPAKVVNRHGGGAMLLREPERMRAIVAAVRRAVPATHPVSAKMRLGYDDDAAAEDCARALAEGGAAEIVVHARTRAQGYTPPAHWHRVAALRAAVAVPLVVNGEIWTVDDARRARAEAGLADLMLGRGLVADPGLARDLRAADAGLAPPGLAWADLGPALARFWARVEARVEPRHRAGRLKQWLNLLRRRHPAAEGHYQALRTVQDPREIARRLGLDAAPAGWPGPAGGRPAPGPAGSPAPAAVILDLTA